MPPKLTTKQFIERCTAVHGTTYDYSEVDYVNAKIKIKISCADHGMFTQKPNNHLSGQGCPECAKLDRKSTCLELYGFETAGHNPDVHAKVRATNQERYGVDYPLQNKNVQEKRDATMFERYGVKSALASNDIFKKTQDALFVNYGVLHPLQNKDILDRTKQTNIERYGFASPLKNVDIKKKQRDTNVEQYGTKSPAQSHMIDILPLIQDREWLFEQYIIHNKTAKYIGYELGVSDATICNYLHHHEIQIRYTVGYSMAAIRWLESIMASENIFIQHAANTGEYNIPTTRYKTDGYCAETNTVYEFHGDCFHGNPDIFSPTDCPNFYRPELTAAELYAATIARENELKALGYNLVVLWENDFKY